MKQFCVKGTTDPSIQVANPEKSTPILDVGTDEAARLDVKPAAGNDITPHSKPLAVVRVVGGQVRQSGGINRLDSGHTLIEWGQLTSS